MDLIVNPGLIIPSNELHWRFSRSSGSGGQNINKTDTRVNLSFNIKNSKALTSYQKHQVTKQLNGQIASRVSILSKFLNRIKKETITQKGPTITDDSLIRLDLKHQNTRCHMIND